MKKTENVGLAIVRDDKILLVKEKREDKFIIPGGVKEKNESDEQALKREIKEELGVDIVDGSLKFIGNFQDVSNENKNTLIKMSYYVGEVNGEITPKEEVEKILWFDKKTDWNKVTHMTRYKLIPALIQRNILK